MNKNWLIRTKNLHLLGPVSKDKLIDLYKNGSIKDDDEVSSGNGYWFFIREKDLVQKYLLGSNTQSFNPVQEAEPVATAKPKVVEAEPELDLNDSQHLPSNDDLAYPDLEGDVELVEPGDDLSLDSLAEMESSDLEYPDEVINEPKAEIKESSKLNNSETSKNKVVHLDSKPNQDHQKYFESLKPQQDNIDLLAPIHPGESKKKNSLVPPVSVAKVAKKSVLSVNVLLGLILVFLMFLAFAVYFRTTILDTLKKISHIELITPVYAQEDLLVQKKNSGI